MCVVRLILAVSDEFWPDARRLFFATDLWMPATTSDLMGALKTAAMMMMQCKYQPSLSLSILQLHPGPCRRCRRSTIAGWSCRAMRRILRGRDARRGTDPEDSPVSEKTLTVARVAILLGSALCGGCCLEDTGLGVGAEGGALGRLKIEGSSAQADPSKGARRVVVKLLARATPTLQTVMAQV
jgi:hypothetical protein